MIGSRDQFVAARRRDWDELEGLLAGGALHRLDGGRISRAAALYRAACADLMRCRAAGYDAELTAFLDGLAARGHNALYAAPPYPAGLLTRLLFADFPRALRRGARFFATASALFLLTFGIGLAGALASRSFAAHVLPEAVLAAMEEAYSKGFGGGRAEGQDVAMAGFYVYNNVGIAFRCFGTGILFGAGSAFFLLYNGLVMGAVMGFVARAGHGGNIFTFVCGHAPLELTAIVISGAAGLQMGWSLVDTGGRSRLGSLRAQARDIVALVLGAAVMLLLAAAVEGFWSPSSAPPPVKWGVAAALSLAVGWWLVVAGRKR